jgi:hypothetical protein
VYPAGCSGTELVGVTLIKDRKLFLRKRNSTVINLTKVAL